MINTYFYETSIGKIGITENGSGITQLTFLKEEIPAGTELNETPLLAKAA